MAITGGIGTSGGSLDFTAIRSLNVTCPANTYPSGTITFNNIQSGGAYWRNNFSNTQQLDIYLCDSAGNNAVKLFTIGLAGGSSDVTTKTATINAPGLIGAGLYIKGVGSVNAQNAITLNNATNVTIDTVSAVQPIYCAASTGGSLTASANYAAPGSTVTLYPVASTGYYLSSYTTTPTVTVTGNTFTMPSSAITVTANFTKTTYNVYPAANPSAGGTVTTNKNHATMGETVTMTATPATGYQFSSWSATGGVTVSNNKFTMPASNVTVTGNFSKISYAVSKAVSPSGGGSITTSKSSATMGETITLNATPSTGYHFTSWSTSPSVTVSSNSFTMPASAITVTGNFAKTSYTVSKASSPNTGGTVTISKSSANYGDTITISASASTGYTFIGWGTSPSLTISNNKFTMPAQNVTVTANFQKNTYTISKAASPAAGGTVTTSANTATYGDIVTVSQATASGYYFSGWTTSPTLSINSSGQFIMPAQNVSITATYKKVSTGSLNKTSMTGGTSVTLTISPESASYSHKYKLSFGTNMETSLTNVAAGTTSVTISVPESWSNQIPNQTSKGSGTLVLETYSGTTFIGNYQITNLTYNVPDSAKPAIGTITTSIARTIGGTTYANVGNYYVQNHCGVRIQTSASSSLSATITSMSVTLSGYTGNNYKKTVSSGSLDFTTGLLTTKGSTTITVTATDTRGRTTTKTSSITVSEYNLPGGSLTVWRVDSAGNADDMGQYGKFQITKNYTAIGSNSLTVKLNGGGTTETITGTTGNILPGDRKTFNLQQEYTITLTLQDSFETTTIIKTLPSARFIIYVSANGKKLGFMKAANLGGSNTETIEFSGDATIYIGSQTLAQYIQSVVSNM